MDGDHRCETREARLALLNEMRYAVEALEVLIVRYHSASLTAEQEAAFQHWRNVLPGLRDNLRVLYASDFAQGMS